MAVITRQIINRLEIEDERDKQVPAKHTDHIYDFLFLSQVVFHFFMFQVFGICLAIA